MKTEICQICHQGPVTHVVSTKGEPLFVGVSEGKRGPVVLRVCAQCAAKYPDSQKL